MDRRGIPTRLSATLQRISVSIVVALLLLSPHQFSMLLCRWRASPWCTTAPHPFIQGGGEFVLCLEIVILCTRDLGSNLFSTRVRVIGSVRIREPYLNRPQPLTLSPIAKRGVASGTVIRESEQKTSQEHSPSLFVLSTTLIAIL